MPTNPTTMKDNEDDGGTGKATARKADEIARSPDRGGDNAPAVTPAKGEDTYATRAQQGKKQDVKKTPERVKKDKAKAAKRSKKKGEVVNEKEMITNFFGKGERVQGPPKLTKRQFMAAKEAEGKPFAVDLSKKENTITKKKSSIKQTAKAKLKEQGKQAKVAATKARKAKPTKAGGKGGVAFADKEEAAKPKHICVVGFNIRIGKGKNALDKFKKKLEGGLEYFKEEHDKNACIVPRDEARSEIAAEDTRRLQRYPKMLHAPW